MAKDNPQDKLVNMQAAALASQVANLAAQLDFQKERFRLLELPQFQTATAIQLDELAWKKAQDTWERAFQEASVTGTYNGQPTQQWLTEQAQLTGVLNGQQTIQGKLTDAQIAQMTQSLVNTQRLTDLEYEKFGLSTRQYDDQHAMDLRKEQANLTGYINGMPTFEREQWQANQATTYLNLLSSLRGPENAFKQLEVLQNTPAGLLQMANNWAGNTSNTAYQARQAPPRATVTGLLNDPNQPSSTWSAPPTWLPPDQAGAAQQTYGMPTTIAGTGFAPVPAYSMTGPTSMVGAVNGDVNAREVAAPAGYSVDPAGTQAPVPAYNYEATRGGSVNVYPPGVPAPAGNPQASTSVPVLTHEAQRIATQAQGAVPAGPGPDPRYGANPQTNTMAGTTYQVPTYQYQPSAMPAPSQINAREYNKATPYEKSLGWARYESEGWDKQAAQDVYKKSLPKYGYQGGTGNVRL